MSNEQFNIIMQAINELASDVKEIKQKQDEHTKKLDELQFSFELMEKEIWQNKKDTFRIKKTMGIE